jgi:hypothetical protein
LEKKREAKDKARDELVEKKEEEERKVKVDVGDKELTRK